MERVPKEKRNSATRVAQGKNVLNQSQGDISSRINNSPQMIAQRMRLRSMFGGAIQLQGPEDEMLQGKLEAAQRVKEEEPLQGKFSCHAPVQLEQQHAQNPNNTGLPDKLKTGIESLSGLTMDHVKVHYNSSQPAQLNALAYAQGSDIHVAPGQEKHLPHEAWHIVQQAQGRVQPTMQMKEGIPVNDDRGLEREADMMGEQALQMKGVTMRVSEGRPGGDVDAQLQNSGPESQMAAQLAGENESALTGGNFIAESNPRPGQVSKAAFLEKLHGSIFAAANAMLAQIGQTASQCPYLARWFTYYASKDALHIEQAIARFAPASASASTIDGFIEAIVARVKTGLQNHIDTGSVDDVPPEIMESKPQPKDFRHIAQRTGSVAQLSCLWSRGGGSGNRNYEQLQQESSQVQITIPIREPKKHYISQGSSVIAQEGDYVQNMGTTSCGLVIAFGTDGIVCYHWPFMTNSRDYHETFNEVARQVGDLRRIEIITNDYVESSRNSYLTTVRAIRDAHGVTTVYYVHPGEIRGIDPCGTLGAAHFNSANPVEERALD